MLVDEATIIVKGGHGGPGKVSFFPKEKSGPDGGDGGKGGDVYLKAVNDIMALRSFTVKKTLSGGNGMRGDSFLKSGVSGTDLVVSVPVGSEIQVQNSDERYELSKEGEIILIAKGGLGGRGNNYFKSSRRTTPLFAQPGLAGEEKELKIILRLIADFGLIGLPNAGKSSLLNELTRANVKVADYPFTTLEPNLGSFEGKILADIPGLIEGASSGKGLGIKFLKHIEKTKVLLHCISTENEDIKEAYNTVRKELKQFNPELLEKEEIIIVTKSDLVEEKTLKSLISTLKSLKKKIISVSIHDWDSLENLKKELENF